MRRYAKAVAALLTTLGVWGATAAPGGYDASELWGLCGVIAAAATVFAVRNEPAPEDLR